MIPAKSSRTFIYTSCFSYRFQKETRKYTKLWVEGAQASAILTRYSWVPRVVLQVATTAAPLLLYRGVPTMHGTSSACCGSNVLRSFWHSALERVEQQMYATTRWMCCPSPNGPNASFSSEFCMFSSVFNLHFRWFSPSSPASGPCSIQRARSDLWSTSRIRLHHLQKGVPRGTRTDTQTQCSTYSTYIHNISQLWAYIILYYHILTIHLFILVILLTVLSSFQWLRCCPPREYFWQRSSICLTARLLKGEHHRRIAMANSKCKARGSGLRVLWDPLHAGVSPVHCDVLVTAWIYRFSVFFSSSCPRTTFSFTSVATELNNQSLRLMGSTRLCVLSWPVLNMSSSARIEWSVCAPHIFTLCADGLAWDGVSRNAVWERMFCACCRGTLCQWTLQTTFQRKNVLQIQAHFILSVLSRCRWRRTLYMNWDTAIPQRPETEPCVVTTFVNCRCQIQ